MQQMLTYYNVMPSFIEEGTNTTLCVFAELSLISLNSIRALDPHNHAGLILDFLLVAIKVVLPKLHALKMLKSPSITPC